LATAALADLNAKAIEIVPPSLRNAIKMRNLFERRWRIAVLARWFKVVMAGR
jgi:hypothetical protein